MRPHKGEMPFQCSKCGIDSQIQATWKRMKWSTHVISNSSAQSFEMDYLYHVIWKHMKWPHNVKSNTSEQSFEMDSFYQVTWKNMKLYTVHTCNKELKSTKCEKRLSLLTRVRSHSSAQSLALDSQYQVTRKHMIWSTHVISN